MSLTDALLLEPFRDPRDIYIALRADGQLGSGTIDDPYDGGTRIDPAISGSVSLDKLEVLAAVGVVHNYQTGDSIAVSGVIGRDASLFNGAFTINAPTSTDFKFVLSGVPKAPLLPPTPLPWRSGLLLAR